jgi:PAS domain S-box-containing protein
MAAHILLVEDEALIAMDEANTLKSHGFSVETVYQGEQAIEAVRERPGYSLVLMDIDLGSGMDGTEAAEKILAEHDIPIVFLTSHPEREYVEKVKTITRYGYVLKSAGEFVLVETIQMALDLFDAHQSLKMENERRRKIEKDRNEYQKILRSTLDAADSLFMVIDRQHRVILSNWKDHEWVPEEERDAMPYCYRVLKHYDAPCSYCPPVKTFGDGRSRWYEDRNPIDGSHKEISVAPILNEEGAVQYVLENVKDITERKEREEMILASERDLHTTLHSIGDAVISTDARGRVVHINPVAEKLTGWEGRQALQRPLQEVLHIVRYDTGERVEDPVKKVLRTGTTVGLGNHSILISADGSRYHIADSAAPIMNDAQEISGVVLVFRDVTENYRRERQLRESERRYRSLFNSIRDAILVANTERRIIDCNTAFTELFGYELEEVSGQPTAAVYESEEEFEQMGKAIREHRGDLTDFVFTVHYRKKDGTVFPGETNVFYQHDEQDNIIGFIGLIRDITERRHTEENLRQALEEKDFLMKELNHRVKNNLQMISSLVTVKDGETQCDLSDVARQIDAIRIVHEKLHQAETTRTVDLYDYFQELLGSIFSSFTIRYVTTVLNTGGHMVNTKTAIPIGLIVNELATNAIKHGFSSEREARFTVDMKLDQTEHYLLTVSNTGSPFPEHIDIHSPSTLGLQLVTNLVAQLGGSIELQRSPSPVFTIRFPADHT